MMPNTSTIHQNLLSHQIAALTGSAINQKVFKQFTLYFTLFLLLAIPALIFSYQTYTQNLEEKLLAQEEAFVSSSVSLLQKEMHTQLTVLMMSAKSKALTDFIKAPSPINQEGTSNLFANLIKTFRNYSDIRLMDNSGNTLLHAVHKNNNAVEINMDEQHQEVGEDFISKALALKPNTIYVSELRLKKENGQVIEPYIPTIQFATPVLDQQGEKAGLLIINYSALEILQNFRYQMRLRINGQGMLIDHDGYWISNHDRSNEWGRDLNQPEKEFEQRYPFAWPVISTSSEGTLKTQNGLFRYQVVKPLDFTQIETPEHAQYGEMNHYILNDSRLNTDWKLVIFLPNQTIQAHSFFFSTAGRLFIFMLFAFVAAIMLLAIRLYEQKKERDNQTIEINNGFKDLYDNAPCGYHAINKQGIVTCINQTELSWLGYHHDDVVGQPFSKFLTEDSQQTFEEFLQRIQTENEIDGAVLEIKTKDNETFFASTSSVAIFDKDEFILAKTSTFDITDRINLEQQLHYIANTDVLTGISNRRHFFESAPEFIADKRNSLPLCLFMLDIDHFKKINDNYGHDVGDLAIKSLAQTIQTHLRKGDVFARLGGEEFVVLVKSNLENGIELAERLRQKVEDIQVRISQDQRLSMSISIGMAMGEKEDFNLDEKIKQADVALYQAKSAGRNRVMVYQEDNTVVSAQNLTFLR
ncbi:MAG: diguanylate cyclase [Vibrio sp.]